MIEDELKELILKEYKSIREFASIAELPYTTVDSILKRGVEKANVINIIKICEVLDIDVGALAKGKIAERKKDENSQEKITAQSIKNSPLSELDSELIEIYKILGSEGKARLLEQARLLREAKK